MHRTTRNSAHLRALFALACVSALTLAACNEDSPEPNSTHTLDSNRSGNLALTMDILDATDVAGFSFRVTPVACESGVPTGAEPLLLPYKPLDAMMINYADHGMVAYGDDARHMFVDHYMVLEPGCYDISAIPMASEEVGSEVCAPANAFNVRVNDLWTTEVVLVSQCDGKGMGGLDVVATLNHPPHIVNTGFTPSKFPYACEEDIVCVSAYDPNNDPLEFRWQQHYGPELFAEPVVVSRVVEDNVTTECARIIPGAVGDYMMGVLIFDTMLDEEGAPIRIESFLRRTDEEATSRAGLNFPLHARADDSMFCVDPETGELQRLSGAREPVYAEGCDITTPDEEAEWPVCLPSTDPGDDCIEVPDNAFRRLIGCNIDGGQVTFTVPDGICPKTVSFTSYSLEANDGTILPYEGQTVHDNVTGVYGPGTHTLNVDLPPACGYQTDLYVGELISELGPGGGHVGRLICADYEEEPECTTTEPNPSEECTDIPDYELRRMLRCQIDGGNVRFTIPEGACAEKLSFSSYSLEGNGGTIRPFEGQTLFDNLTGVYGPGTYELNIDLPPICGYQTDLYLGDVVTELDANGGHVGKLVCADYEEDPTCLDVDPNPVECDELTYEELRNLIGCQIDGGTASFTIPEGTCPTQISFTSYSLEANDGTILPYQGQTLFDNVTDIYGPGDHTVTVDLPPNCGYQVDLYLGDVVTELDAGGGHVGKLFCVEYEEEPGCTTTEPECEELTWEELRNLIGCQIDGGTASFTIPEGTCPTQISFTSYSLEANDGTILPYQGQTLFDNVTDIYGPGDHTVTVDLPPNCGYQVDLYLGDVVTELDAGGGHVGKLFCVEYEEEPGCTEVLICHDPEGERVPMSVPAPELDDHLAHGDLLGVCPTMCEERGCVLVGTQDTANNNSFADVEVEYVCGEVHITSSKDLSNVVLLFSDAQTQKFDNLSGKTGTFAGTGIHEGKEIVTVWVKSGSFQSGDGPGYGERFDLAQCYSTYY